MLVIDNLLINNLICVDYFDTTAQPIMFINY